MIVLCLKHGSKIKDFCLKEGQGLMATAAHLYPNFPPDLPLLPPHPPRPNPNRLMQPQPINATCKQWFRFSESLLGK